MEFVKTKIEKEKIEKFPDRIEKKINCGGRILTTTLYEYELVKVYPRFALYKNLKFENIKETITKEELRNSNIRIISKGDFFESEFFDVWE